MRRRCHLGFQTFDGVEAFEKADQAYVKEIEATIETISSIHAQETMVIPKYMLVLLGDHDDGTRYMIFWEHGQKVKTFYVAVMLVTLVWTI
jgi:hypothetical protein